jgi:predicted DNA-binding transcriptional regulator AlpA
MCAKAFGEMDMCNSGNVELSKPLVVPEEVPGITSHAERLLSIDQAACMLGMSPRWIFKQLQHGQLARIKLGSRTRVRQSDLQQLIANGTIARSSTIASILAIVTFLAVLCGCQSEVRQASHTANLIRETSRSSELRFGVIQRGIAQDEPDLAGIATHAVAGMQEQRRIQALAGGIQERLTQVQDRQSPWIGVLRIWGVIVLAISGVIALSYFGVLPLVGRAIAKGWTFLVRR